jgi:hypothetical protein
MASMQDPNLAPTEKHQAAQEINVHNKLYYDSIYNGAHHHENIFCECVLCILIPNFHCANLLVLEISSLVTQHRGGMLYE